MDDLGSWHERAAPDADTVLALALEARDALPAPFAAGAAALAVRVAELAPDEVLDDLGIADPFELTGLYQGIPLTEKSSFDQPVQPDVIWLYRRALIDEWADRGNVGFGQLVAHVMVHEMAHHFGWSDADIARIDRWWE